MSVGQSGGVGSQGVGFATIVKHWTRVADAEGEGGKEDHTGFFGEEKNVREMDVWMDGGGIGRERM